MQSDLEDAIRHYRNGELDKALAGFLESAAHHPESVIAHYNAGVIYCQLNDPEKAIHHYRLAQQISPEDPDILFNLGATLKDLGRYEEALDCYFAILEDNPKDTETRYNLGVLLMELGLLKEASSCFEDVLETDPSHTPSCTNLAYLYHRRGLKAEALETYTRLLELEPAHKAAAHMKAALTGENPDQPPSEYVEEIFDQFLDYDRTMQKDLEYNTPEKLLAILRDSLPEKRRFDNVLDLGCGTGLSGQVFRSMAGYLAGVDLSLTMLARAEEKQIYDELVQEDILSYLNRIVRKYDLFLAADVFVYCGDLFPVLEEINKSCRPGGLLLLSTELAEEGFFLRETGRYAHSSDYLTETAEQCGFHLLQSRNSEIRKERGEWIEGGLYLFRAGS